jgi:predicted lipoprotein with Yx(FWY)xxD motif
MAALGPMREGPTMRATLRGSTRAGVALLVASLALAACGTEPDQPADDDAAAAEADDETASQDATVGVADTDLGEVLVDGEGRALYLFDPDEQGASTCYDDCAASWPPLLDDDPVAGDGADEALLSTTEREDGQAQVTYDGWPLYHWIGDEQPGDVEGQGVQDVWWVIAPDGQALRGAAATDEPATDEPATDEPAEDEAPAY